MDDGRRRLAEVLDVKHATPALRERLGSDRFEVDGPGTRREADAADARTDLLIDLLAEHVACHRLAPDVHEADPPPFVLEKLPQTLEQVATAVRRHDDGLTAFGDGSEAGTFEGEMAHHFPCLVDGNG